MLQRSGAGFIESPNSFTVILTALIIKAFCVIFGAAPNNSHKKVLVQEAERNPRAVLCCNVVMQF